ncbi:MAG TPA: hypothetical protein VNU97_02125 [Rhizomicrobium sp.]|jgi:hypothetical protein|nr:hypothetical protein [Rhizomicrobium sp.]
MKLLASLAFACATVMAYPALADECHDDTFMAITDDGVIMLASDYQYDVIGTNNTSNWAPGDHVLVCNSLTITDTDDDNSQVLVQPHQG